MAGGGKRPAATDGRELKGEVTRTLLIDAVIASVARHGLEGTTVSRLSEMTGLSRGLVSFHFEGKDRLIEAALTRAMARYEESWEAAVMQVSVPAAKRLHLAVDHDFNFARAHPDVLALWWSAWGEARAKAIYLQSSVSRDARFLADLKMLFCDVGMARSAAAEAAQIVNAYLLGCWLQIHIDEEAGPAKAYRSAGHRLVDQLLDASPLASARNVSRS